MITNNEAIDNFLSGKRHLAAYQFTQLVGLQQKQHQHDQQDSVDEIAFNYGIVNLFTGCPQRSSVIFNELVKRYPRNPRLWFRLAESMLAAERAKLSEFEHLQHSKDHIKTKNKPILIKINPNYCQQQIHFQKHGISNSNILVTIRSYLQKSLDLINEYDNISLITDDIPAQNQSQFMEPSTTTSPTSSSSGSAGAGAAADQKTTTKPSGEAGASHQSSAQPKLSKHLSYVNPYQSISRSELYHLKNKVQLNLAYVYLCMGDPLKALTFTSQCLKCCATGYEKILVNLYHAEACILVGRLDEAIHYLNLEILNMAKSLPSEYSGASGRSKKVVHDATMQNQSSSLKTVITYNLSVAYAAKGEFNNAQQILMGSFEPAKPNPLQVIICSLYIQLQQGQLDAAKRTILNNLPQFR